MERRFRRNDCAAPVKGSFPTKYKIVVFVSFQKPGESAALTRFYSNEIEIE